MSTTHTISLENERGANTNYAVFMVPPEFSGSQQPFMNVWFTTFIPYHGNIEIRAESEYFTWTGTVPQRPLPGVIVNSGMNLPAKLGTETLKGTTYDLKIESGFPTITPGTSTASRGTFEINTGSDFVVPNDRYLVGLAKRNIRGQVAPVASIAPLNNTKIQIKPKLKFIVLESQFVAGEIVDYDSVSRTGGIVDFAEGEGVGKFYARIIQETNGGFKVEYYDRFHDPEE